MKLKITILAIVILVLIAVGAVLKKEGTKTTKTAGTANQKSVTSPLVSPLDLAHPRFFPKPTPPEFVLVVPPITPAPGQEEAHRLATDALFAEVNKAYNFMATYKLWLGKIQDGDNESTSPGYRFWGYLIDNASIDKVNEQVPKADKSWHQKKYPQVAAILEDWKSRHVKYDTMVTLDLIRTDYKILNNDILDVHVPVVDEYLKREKKTGAVTQEWNALKTKLAEIKTEWLTASPSAQMMLHAWYPEYEKWATKAAAKQ